MKLLITVILVSVFTFCSFSQNFEDSYTLEDFRKDKVFIAHLDSITRINNRSPNKKESVNFKSFYACSNKVFEIANRYKQGLAWETEFLLFGKQFYFIEESESLLLFKTNEKDSQVHYLEFYLSKYLNNTNITKVTLSSQNVRSEEIRPRYIFRNSN